MCRIIPSSGDVHKISTLGYTLGRHLFGMFQSGTNSSLAPPSQKFRKEKKGTKKMGFFEVCWLTGSQEWQPIRH